MTKTNGGLPISTRQLSLDFGLNMSLFIDILDSPDERVWKALADNRRRMLMDALSEKRRTTGELCELMPALSRTAVMKHLEILVDAGLVTISREGRQRWNHINPVPLKQVVSRWVSRHTDKRADAALRLKAHAKRKNKE